MGNFLGVGLKTALALAIFTMVLIVVSKVVLTKYHITGLSEFVQAI